MKTSLFFSAVLALVLVSISLTHRGQETPAATPPTAYSNLPAMPRAQLAQWIHPAKAGYQIEDFDVASEWTPITTTLSSDTEKVKAGLCSLKLVSDPGQPAIATKAIDINTTSCTRFSFWVNVETPDAYTMPVTGAIYFTSDPNWSRYMKGEMGYLHRGWNQIVLSRSDFARFGKESFIYRMKLLRIRINAYPGVQTVTYFDDFRVNDAGRAKVLVGFDDGWDTAYTEGMQYMRERGIVGTLYLTKNLMGAYRHLTLFQINEMYDSGWDIANHSASHPHLLNADYATILMEFKTCQDFLLAHGWTRNACYMHVAYPYGEYDNTIIRVMRDMGVLSARTGYSQRQPNEIAEDDTNSRFLLTEENVTGPLQSADALIARIDGAIASGTCINLGFHNLVPGPPTVDSEYNIGEFRKVIDYIKLRRDQGVLDVETAGTWFRDAYPMYVRPDAGGSIFGLDQL